MFTTDLDAELRDQFVAEAEALRRPASELLRELIRDFIQRQREARDYDEFLRLKIEKARGLITAGLWRSHDEVEADFAAQREQLMQSNEA